MKEKIKNFLFQNTSFKQTVAKNSFRLLVSEFFARLFTFLISLWIARHRWKAEFWVYNFVMSFVIFFTLIVDFWLGNLTFRETSKKPEHAWKYLVNVSFIKSILSVLILIIVWIIIKYNPDMKEYGNLIIIFLLHSIITNFTEFFRIFFRSEEKMEHEALLKILNNLTLFICTIGFLLISQSVEYIFYGYLTSSIINLIFSLRYILKYFKFPKEHIDLKFIKHILKMNIPFFLWCVFVYFCGEIIIVILKKLTTESEVGIFSAPYKLLWYVYTIFNVFSLAMFTKLVQASKTSTNRLKHVIWKFAKYHLIISWIFVLIFLIFWKTILSIYWPDFTDATTVKIMNILSIILIFKSMSYVFGNSLTAMSKEYTRLYIQIWVGIINTCCAIFLIKNYNVIWAAYSLLISEICTMLWYAIFTKYHIQKAHQVEIQKNTEAKI